MTTSASPLLSIRAAEFGWPRGASYRVDGWSVASNARIALIGPSGGGKTTLLSVLAGVQKPRSGVVSLLGADLTTLSGPSRDRFRGDHIGIIFQMFNLLPYGSALENVLLPLSFSARRRARAQEERDAKEEAARLLRALGLDADMIGARAVSRLSVGQQQRVAAARALIGRPELILADEPTSALDPAARSDFLRLLFAEAEAANSAIICVTHDPGVADAFDEVLSIEALLTTLEAA